MDPSDQLFRTAHMARRLCFGLIAFGWLISAYLLLRMVSLGTARLRFRLPISATSMCWGCDDALLSAASFLRGIPLPCLGLVYFAILGLLLVLGGIFATRLALLF